MAEDNGEGFLSRWSRRKRGIGDETQADAALPAQTIAHTGDDGPSLEADAAPVAEEDQELAANREAAEAVDLETLTYESDFTVFMKKGVPAALKNAALQKLWRSNPVLAVLDGLNDYDEDYRVAQGVMGQFESAWKVGKGYADKAEEVAAEMEAKSARLAEEREQGKAAEKAASAAAKYEEGAAAVDDPSVDPVRDDTAKDEERAAPVEVAVAGAEAEAAEQPEAAVLPKAAGRRRMRFTTE